jgi:uncharacterized cupredoxin-like copper-binding protein
VTDRATVPSRAPLYVTVGFFAVAISLVLLAMRGAPPPQAPAIGRAGTPDAPRQVAVIMRDYLFDPTPLFLVRGETVRLEIFNGGLEPHELVLGDQAVQSAWQAANAAATPPGPLATSPPASAPPDVGGVRVLVRSGEQASTVWLVPETGDLQVMCHLPGHVAQGMVGGVAWVPGDHGRETPSR